MMKRILFIAYLFTALSLYGQAPQFEWAIQQGGIFVDRGHSIATDTFGNVYTTGTFSNNIILSDTADFDSGSNFYGLVSNGESDVFVSKVDLNGDFVWAVSFGGDERDAGFGITTDADGNVYVTGLFHGSVDFDPGPEAFILSTSINFSSAFVLKLDTNGSLVWARELGDASAFSSSGASWGYSIAVDDNGNVFTTGRAKDNSDFDPGSDEFILSTNTNSDNVFISKLDNDGNFVWAKAIGSEGGELSKAITVDKFNNVYIAGHFQGNIDFDPNSGIYSLSAVGSADLYILSLNNNGDFIWAKSMGGTSASIIGEDIITDDLGNVYVTGSFNGQVDFDPGSSNYELLSAFPRDAFVLKLNESGDFSWAKAIGGIGFSDFGNSIALDQNNNVYTTGAFQDTVDFDPGLGIYELSAVNIDAYILKLNSEGSFIWATSFSTNDEESVVANRGESIVLDKWDNIYTTGSFIDTTDFDPDTSIHNLITYGSTDIFIQKISQTCNANLSINSDNNIFTICEQESISLNAVLPSSIEDVAYTWNTGDTSDFIMVIPDTTTTYSVTVDYSYNNLDCVFSTSVEIAVLEKPDTSYLDFTTCDSLAAGVVEFVYSAQNGCDSIVIESTDFISSPEMPVAPADLVIQEGELPFDLMISEVLNATEYEWTVPADVQIILGQGTNSITIDWDDSVISDSICVSAHNECGSSEADCMEVTVDILDAVEDIDTKGYRIFPNPTADLLNIVFENDKQYEVALRDILGRQLKRVNLANGHIRLSTKNLPDGTYWLEIFNSDEFSLKSPRWEKIAVIKK